MSDLLFEAAELTRIRKHPLLKIKEHISIIAQALGRVE